MNYSAESIPLHAHEITPDDAALFATLASSDVADDGTVALPPGKTITGTEMRRWIRSNER